MLRMFKKYFRIVLVLILVTNCVACKTDKGMVLMPTAETNNELVLALDSYLGQGKSYLFKLDNNKKLSVFCGVKSVDLENIDTVLKDGNNSEAYSSTADKIKSEVFFDKVEKQEEITLTNIQNRKITSLLEKYLKSEKMSMNWDVYDDYRAIYISYKGREEYFHAWYLDKNRDLKSLIDELSASSPFKIRF